ncbi:hypothetical protein DRJ17_03015 [Candidatus Woesearchaeota archaeon]|nr:MAG: hypothetical protein DRJ17_03015 [Candidatus Woesearchaeota archaeon]
MDILFSLQKDGIRVKFENRIYNLKYPKKIFQKYPTAIKKSWFDNFAYLSTLVLPFVNPRVNSLRYNTSYPFFKSSFDKIIYEGIPSAYTDFSENAKEFYRRFVNINYSFANFKIKQIPKYKHKMKNRAVVAYSIGKDSQLTLGVANELGLKPVIIYVNDMVSPSENKLKIEYSKATARDLGLDFVEIKNELEILNDFETWDSQETCINYMHLVTSFVFASLPVAHSYKAKYIFIGNQADMSSSFETKHGYVVNPSTDQTIEATTEHNRMAKLLTSNQTGVYSLIRPLYNIAITKVLFSRYPEIAKYNSSCCCLDVNDEKRWCHECSSCTRTSIYLLALGIDPKLVGLRSKFLDKKHKKFYTLFDRKSKDVDADDYTDVAIEQQMLGFYMAYKNGHKGYLIDLFKRKFLDEAKNREDELYKKYFSVYDTPDIPRELKNRVINIYKEELEEFR